LNVVKLSMKGEDAFSCDALAEVNVDELDIGAFERCVSASNGGGAGVGFDDAERVDGARVRCGGEGMEEGGVGVR
jgi:hypothetical protein